MTLAKRLIWLKKRGCFPSIYLRGNMWRAHVNSSGNIWEDAHYPGVAMELAVKLWIRKGRPMDGMAAKF